MTTSDRKLHEMTELFRELNQILTVFSTNLAEIGRILKERMPEPKNPPTDRQPREIKPIIVPVYVTDSNGNKCNIGHANVFHDGSWETVMPENIYWQTPRVLIEEDVRHYTVDHPDGPIDIEFMSGKVLSKTKIRKKIFTDHELCDEFCARYRFGLGHDLICPTLKQPHYPEDNCLDGHRDDPVKAKTSSPQANTTPPDIVAG